MLAMFKVFRKISKINMLQATTNALGTKRKEPEVVDLTDLDSAQQRFKRAQQEYEASQENLEKVEQNVRKIDQAENELESLLESKGIKPDVLLTALKRIVSKNEINQ
jgi:predicted  nucleic acid-binding Zn-ribbon protein